MSTATAIDREYLKKMVKKVINERTDPLEDPEIKPIASGFLSGRINQAVSDSLSKSLKTLSQKHKEKFQDIVSSLGPEHKWLLSKTNPGRVYKEKKQKTAAGDTVSVKTLIYTVRDEWETVFTQLKALKLSPVEGSDRKNIQNIEKAVEIFIDASKNQQSLKRVSDFDRTDSEYAPSFLQFLKKFHQEELENDATANMDVQILKLLNIRGPSLAKTESFESFYKKRIDEVNQRAPDAAIHYSIWKISEADEALDTSQTIWMVLLGLIALHPAVQATFLASGLAVGFWSLIFVEFIVFEIILPSLFGNIFLPRASQSLGEILARYNDILSDLEAYEEEDKIGEFISRFVEANKLSDKFIEKSFADWEQASGNGAINKLKVAAFEGEVKRGKLNIRDYDKDSLIAAIKNKVSLYNTLEEAYGKTDSKTLTLTHRQALGVYIDKATDAMTKAAELLGKAVGSGMTGGIYQEGARLDTDSAELEINIEIGKILNIRDLTRLGPLKATFSVLYSNFARAGDAKAANILKKRTHGQRNPEELWNTVKNKLSGMEGGEGKIASYKIDMLMKRGWCVFTQMPTFALDLENKLLHVGVMKKDGSAAFVGSYVSDKSNSDIERGFGKMIKYGAIGINKDGSLSLPENDKVALLEIAKICLEKKKAMEKVAETVETKKKVGKVEDRFYQETSEFAKEYSDFYLKLGRVLVRCAALEEHPGRCGGTLSTEIFNAFETARAWHLEIREAR